MSLVESSEFGKGDRYKTAQYPSNIYGYIAEGNGILQLYSLVNYQTLAATVESASAKFEKLNAIAL